MTKTRNNRSRKAKATVRTNKPRSPEAVTKEMNLRKVNAALRSKAFANPPLYSVAISFTLNNKQDLNDPLVWLVSKMGKDAERLCMGSGTCLMTGLRDFSWEGSKDQMTTLLKWIANSPYRIRSVYTDFVGEAF
jgi:hypothetical protein